MGLSGIVTSCLTFDAISEYGSIGEGAEVTTSLGTGLPKFYVSEAVKNGSVISVTAYDRCGNLDRKLDTSQMSDTITGSQLVGAIATQCGFSDASYSPAVQSLKKADITGRTCRQQLESMVKCDGGLIYCDSENRLAFASASGGSSGTSVDTSEMTPLIVGSEKNITQLVCTDSKNSKTYTYGSGSADSSYITEGEYLDADRSSALATKLFINGGSWKYKIWHIERAKVMGDVNPNGSVFVGESSYRVLDIALDFLCSGIYASLNAPAVDISQSAYEDAVSRSLAAKVQTGTKYGHQRINKNKGVADVDSEVVYNSSEEAEAAGLVISDEDEHYTVSYGDGLFYDGDIQCKYPVMSREQLDGGVKFEYHKYFVTVYYTETDGKRTYTRWEREYK